MYKVVIEPSVSKFLKRHPPLRQKALQLFKEIQYQGIMHKDIIRLQGEIDKYRLRIGKYRFLIHHEKKTVFIYIYDAKSRGDVY